MFDDEKKYQNILKEIHQLNRQNILNNNDKIDDLNNKLSNVERNIYNFSNKNYEKIIYILFGITGFNLLISSMSFIFILILPNNQTVPKMNENKENSISSQKKENLLELKKEEIIVDENFENIKPIIKKDTPYFCLNEDKNYKIPFTVEIKGKLYKDKFTFILKDDEKEKDCYIKRENL